MTVKEIIEQAEAEVAELQAKVNAPNVIVCSHVICEECAKKVIENAKEVDLLFIQLQEKTQLINDLKSTQQ
jgi:type III secretion system FlhB-like substrate exporter